MTCQNICRQARKAVLQNGGSECIHPKRVHADEIENPPVYPPSESSKRRKWQSFEALALEIEDYIRLFGTPGVSPRLSELQARGRGYLLRPIRNFGGIKKVAERLNLSGAGMRKRSETELTPVKAKRKPRYRRIPLEIKKEVLAFIEEYGVDGVMPHPRHLRAAGHEELLLRLYQIGSLRSIAKYLGLRWIVY